MPKVTRFAPTLLTSGVGRGGSGRFQDRAGYLLRTEAVQSMRLLAFLILSRVVGIAADRL